MVSGVSTSAGADGRSRVLAAIDIVELIGRSVKLTRRGKDYKGLCPFHQEKTPSFKVDPQEQYFYCFGCKASGNAIDFVMKRDRIAFIDALKLLADEAGVDLPRFGGQKQNASERQMLLDAHSAACVLFEKLLTHEAAGRAAREYLQSRGFDAASIKRFQIGMVPDGWDNLLKSAEMKKFTPAQLAQAGLVKARDGGGFYDTFRNRLMFPIRDENARVIAFGGRAMPGSQDPAKYLNSPETPLFSKSRCVYGLDLARQRIVESRTVAVVEGYTDVVMAHQFGVSNVVSILGTAMTEQHVGILRRFADRIVLLFDADIAGDAAVNRAVELFLTQPVEILISSMPEGLDPDEFLLKHGAAEFQKVLDDGQDVLTYKWRQLTRDFAASSNLTKQQKAVEQYLEVLAGARGSGPIDSLRWGAALTRVSRLTEIPVEQLNRRFKSRAKPRSSAPADAATRDPSAKPQATPTPGRTVLTAQDRAECWLLAALLVEPGRWHDVQHEVSPSDFVEGPRQVLATRYWQHQRDDGEPVFSEFLALLEEEPLKHLAVRLVDEMPADDVEQSLSAAIKYIQESRQRRQDQKHLSDLRRTSEQPGTTADELANLEVSILKQLQTRAKNPDMRRTAK